MFTLNSDSLFSCKVCQKLIHEPIFLPCGETVCRSHSEETTKGNCRFCNETHLIPKTGFPLNRMVQTMLENKLHTLNINSDKFTESKQKVEDLNRRFREMDTLINEPEYFIDEYFRELTRQVDLRRERLFESIGQHSDLLIGQIEEWKSGLVEKAKKEGSGRMAEGMKADKVKLGQLNSMFDSLEIDNAKLEEIISQKASKELGGRVGSMVEKYKKELLGGRVYELISSPIKIEEVFGAIKMEVRNTE